MPKRSKNGSVRITQSLAIIDYLERLQPAPRLVPEGGAERNRVLEIASLIACDIHPLNNLRVLKTLTGSLGVSDAQKNDWLPELDHAGSFRCARSMALR